MLIGLFQHTTIGCVDPEHVVPRGPLPESAYRARVCVGLQAKQGPERAIPPVVLR
jgi:hypothetical protein